MKNIKISQENPERFKNPRFYYTYVDEQGKRHKKLCPAECKSYEEAQNFIRNTKIILECPYLISNIAKDMWSDTIKVQCLNCRKTKEYCNEKVRSKFQGRGIKALRRHWNQEGLRTA